MQDIKTKVDAFIAMLLSEPEMFQDGGVGEENATVLNAALVRPIFIDTSCLLYRLAYAKADTYHKDAGDDDGLLAHMICTDVMRDVAEACNQFACAPVLCFDSKENFRTKVFP